MKKLGILICFLATTLYGFAPASTKGNGTADNTDVASLQKVASDSVKIQNNCPSIQDFYNSLDTKGLSYEAFFYAMHGFYKLSQANKLEKPHLITIFDLSKPSKEERIYIIDLQMRKVLMRSLCSHGGNSGEMYAHSFSNDISSHMTSLGFYIAAETYTGKNGYSLKLDGLEPGFNDNARERAVVIHGADYAEYSFLQGNSYLGRSQGCPALPRGNNDKIINLMKNGSCLFIYAPNNSYLKKSTFLKVETNLVEDFLNNRYHQAV